jgi:hypothetical protein
VKPELMALLGQRVTVTSPHIPINSWTGKLVAIADDPSLIVDLDDGRRMVLQQTCTVTRADGHPEPGQPVDPEAIPDWERAFVGLPSHRDLINSVIASDSGDLLKDLQSAKRVLREESLLDRLDTIAANLQAHIDQRAAEVAQPAIDQARADVEEAQQERDDWRTRFTDLRRELQRQLQVVERRAARAETAIVRARTTIHLNTNGVTRGQVMFEADQWHLGYRACADHITRALSPTDQQEAHGG